MFPLSSYCFITYSNLAQSVLTLLGKPSDFPAPQPGRKFVSVWVFKHSIFEVQPPRSPNFNPLGFYLCGHLQTPMYSAPTELKQTLH